jgi:hypothetical protein
MLGIHDQADVASFKRFDRIVLSTTRDWSQQAQPSPLRPISGRIRDLIQSWSSTHGMGYLARGDAERRSDCGKFRSSFRQLDHQFCSGTSTSSNSADMQGSVFLPLQQWLKNGDEGEGYIFFVFAVASVVAFIGISRACSVYERTIANQ